MCAKIWSKLDYLDAYFITLSLIVLGFILLKIVVLGHVLHIKICYDFYIVPNSFRNHVEFEIDVTLLTFLNSWKELSLAHIRKDRP